MRCAPLFRILFALMLALAASAPLAVHAEMFSWTDESGVRHYTDTKPETEKKLRVMATVASSGAGSSGPGHYTTPGGVTYQVMAPAAPLRQALYERGDYLSVEEHIQSYLNRRQDPMAARDLFLFYRELTEIHSLSAIPSMEDALDRWVRRKPKSHAAYLVRGKFRISHAWKIRGGGWAKDVAPQAWPLFRSLLKKAAQDLETAYQLGPQDPNSSAFLLIIDRAGSVNPSTMENHFQRAIRASPGHYGAYANKLNYLMPKWSGSLPQIQAFTRQCRAQSSQHPLLGQVVALSHYEQDQMDKRKNKKSNYLGRSDVWPEIQRIFEGHLATYPEDLRSRIIYARYAMNANKAAIAALEMDEIGERFRATWLWKTPEAYNRSRSHCYYAYAYKVSDEQAANYLDKALDLDPENDRAWFKLGVNLQNRKQYEQAETAFLKTLEIKNCDAYALINLSTICGKTGRYEEARQYAQKVLGCDPDQRIAAKARRYINSAEHALNP